MSRLPILMYHNVTDQLNEVEKLTIDVDNLENQFKLLVKRKYTTLHFKDLENKTKLASRCVIITFDDTTKNQLDYAIPLLRKYNLKATFFIPFAYIGKFDEWNDSKEAIMTIENLKNIDPLIELGFHSFLHRPYSELNRDEIIGDFEHCFSICKEKNLNVYPIIAYPYGNYQKINPKKDLFFNILKENKMKYGVRIGNKINKFPFKNPYEIKRINILGTDSILIFKLKLKFGTFL